MAGGYSREGWFIYGHHPVWTVVTLCGPAIEAVSMYAREATAHALITYRDRMPAEVWYGRPDISGQYCHTSVHFQRGLHQYTPAMAPITGQIKNRASEEKSMAAGNMVFRPRRHTPGPISG